MQRKVEFSLNAEKSFDKIASFILNEWNLKVQENFLAKFDKSVSAIISNPESFPNAGFKNTKKCVVTKQTTIYYIFDSENFNNFNFRHQAEPRQN